MEDGPQQKMQHDLTRAAMHAVRDRVSRAAAATPHSRRAMRRVEAARGHAAGAYLRQAPQPYGWRRTLPDGRKFPDGLTSHHFRITVARHLQLPIFERYAGRPCPLCGGHLDAQGDHVDACAAMKGLRNTAHNHGRDAVCTLFMDAKMRPTLEKRHLQPDAPYMRPADIYVPDDAPHGLARRGDASQQGKSVCIDVTHRQVLCASHVGRPVADALQDAHAEKAARAAPPGCFMWPLAWSSCGSWHESSLRTTVRSLAAAMWAGEPDEDETTSVRSAQRQIELVWLPRLSAAAHWGTAEAVLHLFRAVQRATDGRVAGQPEEDVQRSDVAGTATNTAVLMGVLV